MITDKLLFERGYKEYNLPPFSKADQFFQKRIKMEDDEDLFIDVFKLNSGEGGPRYRYTFTAQFNTEFPCAFNIETVAWPNVEETVQAVEELFTEMYRFSKPYREIKTKEDI